MKRTLTIILMVMAGVAWGETNKIYVVDNLPITLAPTQSPTNEMKAVSLNRYINSEIATNRVYKIGEIIDGTNVYPVVVGEMVFDTTPEQIRKLARSGKICEVLGHWWEVESVFTFFTSDPNSPMESRKCKLCGKVETKTVEWK